MTNLNMPERFPLAFLPTPLEPLPRLTKHLNGPELWIKRDDQTGLAGGGNKTRKLEFLLADAIANGCDHLITTGAPQSNHCRQTAAAAAKAGLGCTLVLSGSEPEACNGNLLLDRLLGAHIRWAGDAPRAAVMNDVAKQQQALGRKPYVIPLGGSNVIGAAAYVLAMQETLEQCADIGLHPDFIVFATSSGGTQAGLVLGAQAFGYQGKVLGISVDHSAETLATAVSSLATATATHIGLPATADISQRVEINDDYIGAGYAVMGDTERDAIKLLAQMEGILVDPVYTGRALGGLIDLIRWGAFTRGQRVVFWHTGGTPALFAYESAL